MTTATPPRPSRRGSLLRAAPGLLALMLTSCAGDGQFTLLGYTTRPNYDPDIRTVYVPIFQNRTFRREVEFELTRAVVREIEAKTPYKVVSDPSAADTELCGTIISLQKYLLNRGQTNEVREGETVLGVEIVWRDLRSGEVLSQPKRQPPPVALAGPPGPPPPPVPVLVQSEAFYIPEVGESITTAVKANCDRLAVQIVSLMEKPW